MATLLQAIFWITKPRYVLKTYSRSSADSYHAEAHFATFSSNIFHLPGTRNTNSISTTNICQIFNLSFPIQKKKANPTLEAT